MPTQRHVPACLDLCGLVASKAPKRHTWPRWGRMGDSCTGQQGLELGRREPGNMEGPRVRTEEGGSWGQDRVMGGVPVSGWRDGEMEDPRMESQGFPGSEWRDGESSAPGASPPSLGSWLPPRLPDPESGPIRWIWPWCSFRVCEGKGAPESLAFTLTRL